MNTIVKNLCANGRVYPDAFAGAPWKHVDAAARIAYNFSPSWAARFDGVLPYLTFDQYAAEKQRPIPTKKDTVESYLCRLHDWRGGWPCPADKMDLVRAARGDLIRAACVVRGLSVTDADVQKANTTDEVLTALGYTLDSEGVYDFVSDYIHVLQVLVGGIVPSLTEDIDEHDFDLILLDAASYESDCGPCAWRLLVDYSRSSRVYSVCREQMVAV